MGSLESIWSDFLGSKKVKKTFQALKRYLSEDSELSLQDGRDFLCSRNFCVEGKFSQQTLFWGWATRTVYSEDFEAFLEIFDSVAKGFQKEKEESPLSSIGKQCASFAKYMTKNPLKSLLFLTAIAGVGAAEAAQLEDIPEGAVAYPLVEDPTCYVIPTAQDTAMACVDELAREVTVTFESDSESPIVMNDFVNADSRIRFLDRPSCSIIAKRIDSHLPFTTRVDVKLCAANGGYYIAKTQRYGTLNFAEESANFLGTVGRVNDQGQESFSREFQSHGILNPNAGDVTVQMQQINNGDLALVWTENYPAPFNQGGVVAIRTINPDLGSMSDVVRVAAHFNAEHPILLSSQGFSVYASHTWEYAAYYFSAQPALLNSRSFTPAQIPGGRTHSAKEAAVSLAGGTVQVLLFSGAQAWGASDAEHRIFRVAFSPTGVVLIPEEIIDEPATKDNYYPAAAVGQDDNSFCVIWSRFGEALVGTCFDLQGNQLVKRFNEKVIITPISYILSWLVRTDFGYMAVASTHCRCQENTNQFKGVLTDFNLNVIGPEFSIPADMNFSKYGASVLPIDDLEVLFAYAETRRVGVTEHRIGFNKFRLPDVNNMPAKAVYNRSLGANLVGAGGNDVLVASHPSHFTSSLGVDTIFLGVDGPNRVVVTEQVGQMTIERFFVGRDNIDLSAFDSLWRDFGEVPFIQVGEDTHLELGTGKQLILKKVDKNALSPGDFEGNAGQVPLRMGALLPIRYDEGAGSQPIFSGFSFSGSIANLTVSIGFSSLNDNESVIFPSLQGLTRTRSGNTYILSGGTDPAVYESVIRQSTYLNIDTASPEDYQRDVLITATNLSTDTVVSVSTRLTFIANNDAPVFTLPQLIKSIQGERLTFTPNFSDADAVNLRVMLDVAGGIWNLDLASSTGITVTGVQPGQHWVVEGRKQNVVNAFSSFSLQPDGEGFFGSTSLSMTVNDLGEPPKERTQQTLLHINGYPRLEVAGGALEYRERGPAMRIYSALLISEDGPDLSSAELSLSGFSQEDDIIYDAALAQGIMVTEGVEGDRKIWRFERLMPVSQWQSFLRELKYANLQEQLVSSSRVFSLLVNDGELESESVSRHVNVIPVNTAPSIQGPSAAWVGQEDSGISLTGIELLDSDAGENSVEVTLSVEPTFGYLGIQEQSGVTFHLGTQNNSALLILRGSLSALNRALQTLKFFRLIDFYGSGELWVRLNDLGNQGEGGAKTDDKTFRFYVNQTPEWVPPNVLPDLTEQQKTRFLRAFDVRDLDRLFSFSAFITNAKRGDVLDFDDDHNQQVNKESESKSHELVLTARGQPLSTGDWKVLFNQVYFLNDEKDPEPSDRDILIRITDEYGATGASFLQLTLKLVNDAPEIDRSLLPLSVSLKRGGSQRFTFPARLFVDPDGTRSDLQIVLDSCVLGVERTPANAFVFVDNQNQVGNFKCAFFARDREQAESEIVEVDVSVQDDPSSPWPPWLISVVTLSATAAFTVCLELFLRRCIERRDNQEPFYYFTAVRDLVHRLFEALIPAEQKEGSVSETDLGSSSDIMP